MFDYLAKTFWLRWNMFFVGYDLVNLLLMGRTLFLVCGLLQTALLAWGIHLRLRVRVMPHRVKRAVWLSMFPLMLLIVNPLSELADWRWPMRLRAWWENY